MSAQVRSAPSELEFARYRADFPILAERIHGKPLVYLDNGASSQRPTQVLDAERGYAEHLHANVHRGVHTLSQRATDAFEGARERVRVFLNARSSREIIFTRGTTEAINLVAQAYARPRVGPGDEILSPGSSTTPTSCRGRWSPPRPARASSRRRSTAGASSISKRSRRS